MRLIRIYFLKEWLLSFLISLGTFTLAFSIGNLVKLVDLIINKGISPFKVLKLFLMMVPFSLVYTVPISTLISTLLVFGKASADNEIVTLKASGISCRRLSIPFLILGFIFSLISFILMDKVLPHTHYRARLLVFEIGRKNPLAYLEPGTFIKSFKNHIIFFYGMKKDELRNIRIYITEERKPLRTIIAERAKIERVTNTGIWLALYNGTSDEIDPKNPDKFYKLNFKQYSMKLVIKGNRASKIDKKPEEFTIDELRVNIKALKGEGVEVLPLISELYKRYAQPFACLAFIMIGIPLGIRAHRRERSVGYGLGLLIIIFYYVVFVSSETLILNRRMPPQLGHWIPNIIIFTIGLYLYMDLDKVKR